MSDTENVEERKPVVVRNTTDLQRLKLEKLMKHLDKPIIIPEKPKEKGMPSVPDFVRNVMGSSAGAGSGEFHVYRHLRRKEYARQKYMKEKGERERLEQEYHDKLEEYKKKAQDKTAKKRAKRLKRKQKMKTKRLKQNHKTQSEASESENESDEEISDSESEKVNNTDECKERDSDGIPETANRDITTVEGKQDVEHVDVNNGNLKDNGQSEEENVAELHVDANTVEK